MIAQPIALSVAPVALVQESRWPPIMTTSSALSVPGISATVTYDVLPFGKNWLENVELDRDRRGVGSDAINAAEVIGAENHRRRLRRGVVVDLAGAVLCDDHAGDASGALCGEAERGRVIAEERVDALGDLLIREMARRRRRCSAAASAATAAEKLPPRPPRVPSPL